MKRYDLVTNYRCGSSIEEMELSDDGEWIRYEDMAALEHETAYLIERSPRASDPSAVAWYWTGLFREDDADVNHDPWLVLRFPRRDYAEAVLRHFPLLKDFRVVSHGFIYRQPSAAPEPRQGTDA